MTDDGMRVRREVLGDEHVEQGHHLDHRLHARLSGSDHPLRLGRDLVATRPRPQDAQLHHADRTRGGRARSAPSA